MELVQNKMRGTCGLARVWRRRICRMQSPGGWRVGGVGGGGILLFTPLGMCQSDSTFLSSREQPIRPSGGAMWASATVSLGRREIRRNLEPLQPLQKWSSASSGLAQRGRLLWGGAQREQRVIKVRAWGQINTGLASGN